MYNVILWRVRVTTVSGGNATMHPVFSYIISRTALFSGEKRLTEDKMRVLSVSTTSVYNIPHPKKNAEIKM
jgi:hypothetical protein